MSKDYIIPGNRIPGDAATFKASLVKQVEELAATSERVALSGRRAREVYGRFIDYLHTLDPDHPSFSALYRIGHKGNEWVPTEGQKMVVSRLGGMNVPDVTSEYVLGEIEIKGIEDAIAAEHKRVEANARKQADEQVRQRVSAAEAAVEKAQAEAQKYKTELIQAQAELKEVKEDRTYLLGLVDVEDVATNGNARPEKETTDTYRRRNPGPVAGQLPYGVYETSRKSGVVYEIGIPSPEDSRKTLFEIVGPDWQEAAAERERRMAEREPQPKQAKRDPEQQSGSASSMKELLGS